MQTTSTWARLLPTRLREGWFYRSMSGEITSLKSHLKLVHLPRRKRRACSRDKISRKCEHISIISNLFQVEVLATQEHNRFCSRIQSNLYNGSLFVLISIPQDSTMQHLHTSPCNLENSYISSEKRIKTYTNKCFSKKTNVSLPCSSGKWNRNARGTGTRSKRNIQDVMENTTSIL